MSLMPRDATAYAAALAALKPAGTAWPQDPDATQTAVETALARTPARLDARATYLLTDAFPADAYELLPEWEATLGLPDPCAGPAPTIQQRQAQVLARLTATGGQSIPYFIAFAAALGFEVTVTEYAVARADFMLADDPVNGDAWAYAWTINAPAGATFEFAADISAADEPLAAWGNAVLECEIARYAPAETVPLFAYA